MGPQGATGPAGKVELIVCKTVAVGTQSENLCTMRFVTGAVTLKASPSAVLSRSGHIVARGYLIKNGAHIELQFNSLPKLARGTYTVRFRTAKGRPRAEMVSIG
jgi:hypothetical protein